MGKGDYLGGHTIITPGSDWFSKKPKHHKYKSKKKKNRPKRVKSQSEIDNHNLVRIELLQTYENDGVFNIDLDRWPQWLQDEIKSMRGLVSWASKRRQKLRAIEEQMKQVTNK